jgi:hypothetical protein
MQKYTKSTKLSYPISQKANTTPKNSHAKLHNFHCNCCILTIRHIKILNFMSRALEVAKVGPRRAKEVKVGNSLVDDIRPHKYDKSMAHSMAKESIHAQRLIMSKATFKRGQQQKPYHFYILAQPRLPTLIDLLLHRAVGLSWKEEQMQI